MEEGQIDEWMVREGDPQTSTADIKPFVPCQLHVEVWLSLKNTGAKHPESDNKVISIKSCAYIAICHIENL